MLGAVGDLLEDVVVRLHETVNHASDTQATVLRRRGGSAANVVEAAVRAGAPARFIGQVGGDGVGQWLTDQLVALGAEVVVRREGRTGTIIVLLDVNGERTMLADRATATELSPPDPVWLDGLHTLHLPFYSLEIEPLASTSMTLAAMAKQRGLTVSIDMSSAAVLERYGVPRALSVIRFLQPTVVLANELEAQVLGEGLRPERLGGAMVIVKRGAEPAIVHRAGGASVEVPAVLVPGVSDTTGAGDAFAAGLLIALARGDDAIAAVHNGHVVAAAAVRRASLLPEA
ncbi:MAG: sugar kinase [Actinobacteria bacterium]|jgi:sugar/nucleoside kinase (ribokinase family)|uniref:Unannotated protein n=1 Tax=freshwater metagenome TaxID=449393 RepID=A0A6J6ZAT5_9ZZZZ|nr:sugar kinase [Actinomycetota bacterium]MSW76682.1 sugar kinase [Actinomycetota bacterium]MSX54680.1 sugar kinase [Actinomycetota bacterium]MSX92966.1 sugar kinase [Actinomycetota bacterium]MSZ82129.1 sugar kinase [Actinomycetota bacterium]